MGTLKDIADRARSRIGDGYIMGATGWICSESRREQQAKQYPDYRDLILTTGKRWDGKRCWDCAQLVKDACSAAGIKLVSGATSQWTKTRWKASGLISSIPADNTGIILYRQYGTRMQHTGVGVGGGMVVDARGTAYGVIMSMMSSYGWTHWAMPDVDGQEEKPMETNAVVSVAGGGTVRLRKSPSTDASVITNIRSGTAVFAEEAKNGWCAVRDEYHSGYMMAEYIVFAPDQQGQTEIENLKRKLSELENRIKVLEDHQHD